MTEINHLPGVSLPRAHFQHASLVEHLPSFAEYPTSTDYLVAFAVRDKVATLFLGEHPFINKLSSEVHVRARMVDLCEYVRSTLRRDRPVDEGCLRHLFGRSGAPWSRAERRWYSSTKKCPLV